MYYCNINVICKDGLKMAYTVLTKHGKRKVVTISMYDFQPPLPESSTPSDIQDTTSAEGQVTQSEDSDGDGGNPTLDPSTTEAEDATEGGRSSGGSENGIVGSTFTTGVFDPPTGSGMQPSHSEEETASPTAPVGEPEETHHTIENLPGDETTEHEVTAASTDCKKNSYK